MDNNQFLQLLRNDYLKRVEKNSRFSLRAYALYLGVNPATLSHVLRDKRKASEKFKEQVLGVLKKSM